MPKDNFKEVPLVASADVTKKKIPRPVVAQAPITRTDALYFTTGGGTFEQEPIKGDFAATVGGTALIVNITDDASGKIRETYEVNIQDVVAAIVEARARG